MPELPEVELIRQELNNKVTDKQIVQITFDEDKILRPSPEIFREGVRNQKIQKIGRQAKLLVFYLKPEGYFTCHLRLSGRLLVRESGDPEDKYVHATLKFEDGTELRFSEARKFGYFRYVPDNEVLGEILSKYGPEPLDDLDREKFVEILSSTRKRIKSLLMDQKRISGIGNIYANDALWMSGIHPLTPANQLSEEEATKLYQSILKVLKEALDLGGSSDQWYRHTDGSEGAYQNNFKVYSLKGEPCPRCGEEIVYDKVGGRGTFWCPHCQEEYS